MSRRFLASMAALAFVTVALIAGGAGSRAIAQDRQQQDQQQQQQHKHITPTAKNLNESYKTDCESFAKGFESEGREIFDKRLDVLNVIGLKPGMNVADIGAGSGLFSRLMAQRVGPTGTVYAVEISSCLVDHISKTVSAMELRNVEAILGDPRSPKLAEHSVDVVFIAESYHHFEYPREMLQEIKKALRPDGLLLIIDYERIEGVSPRFVLDMVRAGKGTFTDEIRNAGFELVEEVPMLEGDYVLKFKHREALRDASPLPGR